MKTIIKKTIILACVTGGFLFTSPSQVKAQELGARFGDVVGNDWAVDFIVSSGQFSRIHGDVSFGTGLGVDLLWDFMYKPLQGEAFHWYVGVGPSMLFHDPFFLGAAGEIGLEYHFNNAPIALGIDWRPTLRLTDDVDFITDAFGFNVRYVFGKK